MASVLDNENILETALSQSFSPAPSRRESVLVQSHSSTSQIASEAVAVSEGTTEESSGSNNAWKAEYEAQQESWKTESAAAREKAEKERERWEAIRAAQALKKGKVTHEESTETEWENVSEKASLHGISVATSSISHSPSPADVRDLVTGEKQKLPSNILDAPHPADSHLKQDSAEKWEDVPSDVDSSFPSMSFPDRPDTPSPPNNSPDVHPPISATLSIFDSSLPARTRAIALFSSLAINLALPFVNGVMLGFGEIFAKNVLLDWLGWKTKPAPGSTAALRGLGSQRTRPSR